MGKKYVSHILHPKGLVPSIPKFFMTSMRTHSVRKSKLDMRKIFTRSTTHPVLAKDVGDSNADARDLFAVANLLVCM